MNQSTTGNQTFLNSLKRAEYAIKETIVRGALTGVPLFRIREEIRETIREADSQLPMDVIDREAYIQGLRDFAERVIESRYKRPRAWFALLLMGFLAMGLGPKNLVEATRLIRKMDSTQRETLQKLIKDASFEVEAERITGISKEQAQRTLKLEKDMWSERKGYPNVTDYEKKLKEYIGDASKDDMAPSVEGKKRITMWQKAELDIRHQEQLKMLDGLKQEGVKLAWASTHPDCSHRCEKWQGKLFDIVNEPQGKGFKMGYKIEGHEVYSLKRVISVKDKYGYENNIIVGFNCRHQLIPYEKGKKPVTPYTEKEVAEQRETISKIREMEREIRRTKTKAGLWATVSPTESKRLMAKAKELTSQYKEYCESHGYAWLPYRI